MRFLEIDVPGAKWDELVEAASFANMRARSKELTPEVTTGLVNADSDPTISNRTVVPR
jgi:hypothetical protein